MSADRDRTDRLNDLLDALAAGDQSSLREIDPDMTEAVRRFFVCDDAPALPRELSMQLWEDLMSQTVSAGVIPLRQPIPAVPALNSHVPRLGRSRPAAAPARPRRWVRGHWALAQLATVALLLITLLGIYRVAWNGRSPGSSPNHAGVPAATTSCTAAGGDASVATGSPVALHLPTANPDAKVNDTVSFVWATDGAPETPTQISHMAIDPQCRLWVLDPMSDRFLIFDLDGTLLETWGESGSGDGQFDFGGGQSDLVNGIAFAPDGGFYVSDGVNLRIQHFDAERRFVRAWSASGSDPTKSNTPGWLTVGPDGNVYVIVTSVQEIIRVYTPDGSFVRAFGNNDPGLGRLNGSGPLVFDASGNLWVVDFGGRALVQFSPDGEPLARLEPPEMGTDPVGLAIDAAGRFFVVDLEEDTVAVFAPDGTFLYAWGELGLGDGEFLDPHSIVLDGSGGVYVTDFGSPRIQKFLIQP